MSLEYVTKTFMKGLEEYHEIFNKNGGNFTPSPSVTPKGQIEIEASKGISNNVKDMPEEDIEEPCAISSSGIHFFNK